MKGSVLALADPLRVWRLDDAVHAASCCSGIGAQRLGGRWNPKGVAAVYCSLDPATAILEVAVHKGFAALDVKPHVLSVIEIADPAEVFVMAAASVPNANWLTPGLPSDGQQQLGKSLLAKHRFFAVPSAVSRHSWNLVFDPAKAAGKFRLLLQEPFSLDTRLNPPKV